MHALVNRWTRRLLLALLAMTALALAGCSSDSDGAATSTTTPPPIPTSAEPLAGRWQTTDPDGLCDTFDELEPPRIIEIAHPTDDAPYPTAIQISDDPCLADGSIAIAPNPGTDSSVLAFGGPTGAPEQSLAEISSIGNRSFDLHVGDTTVHFERIGDQVPFEESTLLGLPDPGDALTARNVGLAAGLTVLFLVLLGLPALVLDRMVELDHDAIGRRWSGLVARLPGTAPAGSDANGSSFWRSSTGVAASLVVSAALASLMQPGWGPNRATATTAFGFLAAFAVVTGTVAAATRTFLHRQEHTGTAEGLPAAPALVLAGVIASRLAGFVPGFAYGLLVRFTPDAELDEADRGRLAARTGTLALGLGAVAWLAMGVLRHLPDGLAQQLPTAIAGGTVTVAAEALVIALLPARPFPGHAFAHRHPVRWAATWAGSVFLFALVVLRPGLDDAQSAAAWWVLTLGLGLTVVALAVWRGNATPARPLPPPATDT